ncbi:hypothetical protein ACA910_013260 [Epithemia clementina (nom. ined.)]
MTNTEQSSMKKVPDGILRPSSYSNLESLHSSPNKASSPVVSPKSIEGIHSNLTNSPKRNWERRNSSSTILSHAALGKFSTERFYTLSEIQTHAPTVIFLQNLASGEANPIYAVADDGDVDSSEVNQRLPQQEQGSEFQKYSILYVLWRPQMTDDAHVFVDNVLRECIEMVQRHVVISPSTDYSISNSASEERIRAGSADLKADDQIKENTTKRSTSSRTQPEPYEGKENVESLHAMDKATSLSLRQLSHKEEPQSNTTSLYIVVERVSPPTVDNDATLESLHQTQEAIAEQVVRHAAIQLRDLCEGISVYCANHERAAPGLEACMNAVSVGAADRRKYASSKTNEDILDDGFGGSGSDKPLDSNSYMGLVADRSDDLLGLQSQQSTDAAQGVMQSCWCAEWNGRGNLNSFAKRAHAQWRLDRGLPSLFLAGQRKPTVPRRSRGRKEFFDEQALDQAIKRFLYDFGVVTFAILYVMFHYGQELYELFLEWSEWADRLLRHLR